MNYDESENHQPGGDDPGSCTSKNVLRDHLVQLLPVSAYKSNTHHVPLCTQYDSQEEIGCLTLAHPEHDPQAVQEGSLQLSIHTKNNRQQLGGNNEGVIITQPTNNDVLLPTLLFLTSPKHNINQ